MAGARIVAAGLRDATGALLGEAASGPANTRLGLEIAQQQVAHVARATLQDAGLGEEAVKRTHVGIGLAGLHIASDKGGLQGVVTSVRIPSPRE